MKTVNPSISIIVPVYKVEKYLNRCLDSIIAQTFTDWECILIDDGSPDNCGKICDDYAKKDERFVVIHQENAGVSAARNAGLDMAKGEYIGFVDGDDWIESNTYEIAINTAIKENADLVEWGCALNDGVKDYKYLIHPEGAFDLFNTQVQLWHGPCTKLIKKSVLSMYGLKFPQGIALAEDMYLSTKLFYYSKKSFGLSNCLYHYYQNPESATKLITIKKINDECTVVDELESFFKEEKASKYWFDLIFEKKMKAKNKYIFMLNKPNYKLWRKKYKDVTWGLFKISPLLTKVYYFFIVLHLDFIAILMHKLRYGK